MLQDLVGGSFEKVGDEFLNYFVGLCNLKSFESVLDVGCGSGRMALPLTKFLEPAGHYHGFDVSREAIDWCRTNITPAFPNFVFQSLDIRNGPYNPEGRFEPAEVTFPYEANVFDFVFLASVFTHLLPSALERYLSEVARVLKPGGRCLITFFLLNEQSRQLIEEGKGTYNFEHAGRGYRTVNPARPEDAIAYPESTIRELYERCGMKLCEPVRYGSWCGRKEYLSFQDIVIARKPSLDST